MISKQEILEYAERMGKVNSGELVKKFGVSRQYVNRLLKELRATNQLVKIGSTRSAYYIHGSLRSNKKLTKLSYSNIYINKGLEEHRVLDQISSLPELVSLSDNIRSIFDYAFSEMLNNAIEHSKSKKIRVEISDLGSFLTFVIEDGGVGVFKSIMKKNKLDSELEAVQDLLKGKTTTMPKSHSGEGIFFTSKVADIFTLDSFGYQLIVNNQIPDIFVQKIKKIKKGTSVKFQIDKKSKVHLNDIFKKYTNIDDESDYGFDKTEIKVKLYTVGGVYVSRSQARRILSGLEKFKLIVFDFDRVPMVGQAFADEIFRVFHNKYPEIKFEMINMAEGVKFMVERAININK
ncbi:MAG TPA: DUF4325 domain-containing protein [bacterium]|nr:DUF4325 domain-containing protein [bacterium]